MTAINEIAPDLFRLSVYVPDFDMQFHHFLVPIRDRSRYELEVRSRAARSSKSGIIS